MENFDAFNWDTMKSAVGADPFADTSKKFEEDKRYYKLTKDAAGKGVAVIRFLPDIDRKTIQKVQKIGTTIAKNGKKRFMNEISPQTNGAKCPFQEEWARLYNLGEKEASKNFNRVTRYIANIKVILDPANPENNGKIFLLDMSSSLANKLQAALEPSEADLATGEKPKQLFNPLKGNNFKLSVSMGANDIATYDTSKVIEEETSIYSTVEEALEDIKNNTYKLADLVDPKNLLSYDELVEKLKWVTWQDTNTTEVSTASTASTTTEVSTTTPAPKVEAEKPLEKPAEVATGTPDLEALLATLSN